MSWRDVLKALSKRGFKPVWQSHCRRNFEGSFVVIPRNDEIKPGTLLSIIDQAGVTKEEFLKLL